MIAKTLFSSLFLAIIALTATTPSAQEIRIAVASNFAKPMTALVKQFEANSFYKVTLSFSSTGKHYAQIVNGAPFDLFFAADIDRPKRLEKEGVALLGTRFTYAIGKLVLWSPKAKFVDSNATILTQNNFRYLAIANPRLAPYGKAAKELLTAKDLWKKFAGRIVRGENINQTFQFVRSGNAELGFVAYSQIKQGDNYLGGSFWKVPQTLYTPIEQQAVLLTDNAAAHAFSAFVRSTAGLKTIHRYGYDTL